jgi:hypothetical protein
MAKRKADPARAAFRVFSQKGPVNRLTSQIAAQKAFREIEHLLLGEEISALNTARSHALMTQEGRREFDQACAKIKARLFPEK